jgi:acid phosphatase family membrane protein YuiD
MYVLSELSRNLMLIAALAGWAVAQIAKGLLILIREKRLSLERFLGSGGMPSSHSATVSALTTAAALQYGPSSGIFAVSAVMSIIVIYDARGVRREAGRHGQVLNELLEFLQAPFDQNKSFDELVGHTPFEVFVGIIVGILVCLGLNQLI